MSLYYFDDKMFRTINVLVANHFKDKLRKAAIGLHKLRPYSKINEFSNEFFASKFLLSIMGI